LPLSEQASPQTFFIESGVPHAHFVRKLDELWERGGFNIL
jgi:hypothetical protein